MASAGPPTHSQVHSDDESAPVDALLRPDRVAIAMCGGIVEHEPTLGNQRANRQQRISGIILNPRTHLEMRRGGAGYRA